MGSDGIGGQYSKASVVGGDVSAEATARAAADALLAADIKVIGETLNLDVTNTTDEYSTIQTAITNVYSQGGGPVLLPPTPPTGAIKCSGLIDVPGFVAVRGNGKRETRIKGTSSGSGIIFRGVADTESSTTRGRGGASGWFQFDGNQLSTTVFETHAVNRNFHDMRLSNPKAAGGTAWLLDGAQNNNFFGCEAEDSFHTPSSLTRGVVLDGGASGNNFHGTSLNEFTNGHVVFDASHENTDPNLTNAVSNNNWFYGNMIERSDSGNPIIIVKACGTNGFLGGNITLGQDLDPTGEIDLIDISNTAARSYSTIGSGGYATKGMRFYGIIFTCPLAADGTTRWGNVFHCHDDLTSWHDAVYVDPSCTYSNCKYLARIDAGSVVVRAPGADNSSGGGLVGWSNPAGAGKINTRKQSAAGTISTKSTIDYYELSGNTDINTLTATYSGHKITILFSGTLTVSTSIGNIKLSGGADMSATPNDVLSLICDGTNWHETGRVVK